MDGLLSGVTSFNHIFPVFADTGGWLSSLKEDLFEFTHSHVPQGVLPSPSFCLVSCEVVVVRWPFPQGEPGCTEIQHWPTPRWFALRNANTGRLQCLRSCSSVWQRAPTGSLSRKKPLRESQGPQGNTCSTKGLQASASSLVSLTDTLAQCSSQWKQDPEEQQQQTKKLCSLRGY